MKTIILIILAIFYINLSYSQQFCSDYIDNEWSDARYNVGEGPNSQYVVLDNETELMWQQCSSGISDLPNSSCGFGVALTYSWQEALLVAQMINTSINGYAGFHDWRLPNIKELQTLVSLKCSNPAINSNVFPNTPYDFPFWSSSPSKYDSNSSSWIVEFDFEPNIAPHLRSEKNYVRLVRAGK